MEEAGLLVDEKNQELTAKKEQFIDQYTSHCSYFASSFSRELQGQAKHSLTHTINSIYLKAISRWQEKQAAMTTAVNNMLGNYYDYIVEKAETDQNAANNFVKFVYQQLL